MKWRQMKKNERMFGGRSWRTTPWQWKKLMRQEVTKLCNSPQLQLEAIERWIEFEEACEADWKKEVRRLRSDDSL